MRRGGPKAAGLTLLAVVLAPPACGSEARCLAACVDSSSTSFRPPISQPGVYVIDLGVAHCSVELPALFGSCDHPELRVDIRDFAITGVSGTFPLTPSFNATITRDGQTVLSTTVTASSRQANHVCGQSCQSATYGIDIPDELVRGPRAACATALLDGTYAIDEQRFDGDCPELDSDDRLTLAAGVQTFDAADCSGELESFSPSECTLVSTASCTSAALDARWQLDLTDALSDGSRLLGRAELEMYAPIACRAAFFVDLRRVE